MQKALGGGDERTERICKQLLSVSLSQGDSQTCDGGKRSVRLGWINHRSSPGFARTERKYRGDPKGQTEKNLWGAKSGSDFTVSEET